MMLWDFGFLISDCGFSSRRSRCAFSIRNALTLIELLITITILATLATMFLGASNAAIESARAARTKTTINKIHTLLMERWGSYTTRRILVETTSGAPGRFQAAERLDALRSLMLLEMPERWSEVGTLQVGISPYHLDLTAPRYSGLQTALYGQYARRKTASVTIENESAECLFMIVMFATGDGEARTLFSRQDIGDTDGDGASEFLDGWGRPIHFVRWPKGFTSSSDYQSNDNVGDHDPFDMFRVDTADTRVSGDLNRANRLVPLVVSAGPDGILDLITMRDANFRYQRTEFKITVPGTTITTRILDPYQTVLANNSTNYQMADEFDTDDGGDGEGGNGDQNWQDNIHNHLQDGR